MTRAVPDGAGQRLERVVDQVAEDGRECLQLLRRLAEPRVVADLQAQPALARLGGLAEQQADDQRRRDA